MLFKLERGGKGVQVHPFQYAVLFTACVILFELRSSACIIYLFIT